MTGATIWNPPVPVQRGDRINRLVLTPQLNTGYFKDTPLGIFFLLNYKSLPRAPCRTKSSHPKKTFPPPCAKDSNSGAKTMVSHPSLARMSPLSSIVFGNNIVQNYATTFGDKLSLPYCRRFRKPSSTAKTNKLLLFASFVQCFTTQPFPRHSWTKMFLNSSRRQKNKSSKQ